MTTVTSTAASTTAASGSSTDPLASLSSNFGDFLNLLMTQLQNQDPSSPMDANSFTSELVEFTSVEQQINTNTSLTQLIQLTQAEDTIQSSAVLGKQVTATSSQLSLQNGTATLDITAPSAEPVSITIQDSAGDTVAQSTLNATQGANVWTWNGANGSGQTEPDGAYNVTVTDGSGNAVPFSVVGTATGVTTQNSAISLQMGSLSIPFSDVTSVGNGN